MTSDEMFALKPQLEAEAKRKQAAKKIERMHDLYGKREDARCKDCVSFVRVQFAKVYRKCERYGNTRGAGTDWLSNYVACGKFTPRA